VLDLSNNVDKNTAIISRMLLLTRKQPLTMIDWSSNRSKERRIKRRYDPHRCINSNDVEQNYKIISQTIKRSQLSFTQNLPEIQGSVFPIMSCDVIMLILSLVPINRYTCIGNIGNECTKRQLILICYSSRYLIW
jgi:hypothetical protein